jgi:hypothetical protein
MGEMISSEFDNKNFYSQGIAHPQGGVSQLRTTEPQ